MTATESKWHAEVSAGHRWGAEWSDLFTQGKPKELAELTALWEAASPLSEADHTIVNQIISLEICNWKLIDNIIDLTAAIGHHTPIGNGDGIGHRESMSHERWEMAWAYYLALQQYLVGNGSSTDAFVPMLERVDPDGGIRAKIRDLLGEHDEAKDLLVHRFLYTMQWVVFRFPWGSLSQKVQHAGTKMIEERLRELEVDPEILKHLEWGCVDGRLQPCGHKFERRLDIILSSIGVKKWRGAIPMRGTDGLGLSQNLDTYLQPIMAWLSQDESLDQHRQQEPGRTIIENLGEPDPTKRFLARLLQSLLASQQIEARIKGEERAAQNQ